MSIFIVNIKLFYLAGSYAQLTLLGHPKLQTQKTISNDSQNGRVQFRTQNSTPERSNNTNTVSVVFDGKKARDIYEKTFKQFEVLIHILKFVL